MISEFKIWIYFFVIYAMSRGIHPTQTRAFIPTSRAFITRLQPVETRQL